MDRVADHKLVNVALAGDNQAAMFILKNRGGWKER